MVERLARWALDNRFLVLVLGTVLVVAGVSAMRRLPIDAVPDVTNVQVQVLTKAPALAPLEIERMVTFPVESALAGMPALQEVRSESMFGLSAVTAVFEEGTDIYRARQLVQERLVEARSRIPGGYGEPEMAPISTGLGEVYQFEVRGEPSCPSAQDRPDCWSPMELRTLLDWFIAYQLKNVKGVVEVNSYGGDLKTYEVQPDPAAMRAYRVSLSDIFDALTSNNRNAGGAYLLRHNEQVLIRGEGQVTGLDDVGDIVIRTSEAGTPLYIRDVAAVVLAPKVRQGVVTRDGRGEAVTGIVMMLMGENSRDVVERVKAKIRDVQKSLPDGVVIEPFYDRADLVDRTIRTVATNLAEGGLLVALVLFVMLGSLRGGLIVAGVIPLSLMFAFIGMLLAGVSGNLMSLGAIDFGLIVDGAVVMVENVFRRLSHPPGSGRSVREVVREAIVEMARPVAFAVGIILVVYLPVLTLTDVEGKTFRPMALTVLFALGGSLVLALTLVPVMANLIIRRAPRRAETHVVAGFRRAYAPVLGWVFAHRRWTLAIAAAVFAAGLAKAPFLGAEFLPRLDEGSLAVLIWRLPSVSPEEAARQTTHVEQVLLREFAPEVAGMVSKSGRPEIATDPQGVETSDCIIALHPRGQWRFRSAEDLVEAMQAVLRRDVPGAAFSFSQPIELRTSELVAGVRSDVAVKVSGPDLGVLSRVATEIGRVLAGVPGAADVKVEQTAGLPVLTIRVDREAAARHGVSVDRALDAVEALGGREVGTVLEGDKRFALQVRFPETVRNDEAAIARIPVAGRGGQLLPLGALTTFDTASGPLRISREQAVRRTTVEVNVRGTDLASFVAAAREAVEMQVKMPPGYTLAWGGEYQHLERAASRLGVVVPVALLLIFVLLHAAFGSMRPAALIFLNVPFAAIGGVFSLALRGLPFSISAGVGFIALFGVAVMNGVVLVTHIRRLEREQGLEPVAAAREGALGRMRPVLTTALVASLGFLPMALSTSAGAEVQRPLATVVIGGLITSTALTLCVLPVLHGVLGEARIRTANRLRKGI